MCIRDRSHTWDSSIRNLNILSCPRIITRSYKATVLHDFFCTLWSSAHLRCFTFSVIASKILQASSYGLDSQGCHCRSQSLAGIFQLASHTGNCALHMKIEQHRPARFRMVHPNPGRFIQPLALHPSAKFGSQVCIRLFDF